MGEELKQRGYESAMKSVFMLERKKVRESEREREKEKEGKEAVESLLCFSYITLQREQCPL